MFLKTSCGHMMTDAVGSKTMRQNDGLNMKNEIEIDETDWN